MIGDDLGKYTVTELCSFILAGKTIAGVRFGYHISVIVDGFDPTIKGTIEGEAFITLAGPWILSKGVANLSYLHDDGFMGLSNADQLLQISQVAERKILAVAVSSETADLLIEIEDDWHLIASGYHAEMVETWHVGLKGRLSLFTVDGIVTSLGQLPPDR